MSRGLNSRFKIFYTDADTLLSKLRLIIEASCYDVVVITGVLPKNSFFIWMVTSCF